MQLSRTEASWSRGQSQSRKVSLNWSGLQHLSEAPGMILTQTTHGRLKERKTQEVRVGSHTSRRQAQGRRWPSSCRAVAESALRGSVLGLPGAPTSGPSSGHREGRGLQEEGGGGGRKGRAEGGKGKE